MAKNTGLIIGGGVMLLAVIALAMKGGGGTGNRTIKVPVPYPNGPLKTVKESELAQYGYVVDATDGKVYHSSQYPPTAGTTGSGGQPLSFAQWAAILQGVMNQGVSAYNAVNQALAPSINITTTGDTTASVIVKAGLQTKAFNINKGYSLGGQINNNVVYEVDASATTSKVMIKKIEDDSVIATKTLTWATGIIS